MASTTILLSRAIGGRVVHHDTFEDALTAQDQVDDTGQIEYFCAGGIGGGDECAGGMGWIDNVHALAVFDLFTRDADLFQNFVCRSADRRLVHQIAAMPKPAAKRETLLDDQRAEPHVGQVVGAKEARWPGADDDHIAFNQLVEFLVVLARNLPGDIAFAQRRRFWFSHGGHSSADVRAGIR